MKKRRVLIGIIVVALLAGALAYYFISNEIRDVEAYTSIEYMKKKKITASLKIAGDKELTQLAELLKKTDTLENYNRAFQGTDRLASLSPRIYEKIPAGENVVYLTFDDGPYADGDGAHVSDDRLIEIMLEKKATGTFFCQGPWIIKNPALVKRIIDSGNNIGNHTYHHPPDGCSMGPVTCDECRKLEYLNPAWQMREILWCRTAFMMAMKGDRKGLTNYFRSPHGSGVYGYRNHPANPDVIARIASAGYVIINGNIMLSDARKPLSKGALIRAYRSYFRRKEPGVYRGEILWLHSGLKPTAEALPEILDMLHEKGYRVSALPGGL